MEDMKKEILDRFVSYVKVHTTSIDGQSEIPSASREFDLAHILEKELKEAGLSDVECDRHCYVSAVLPASEGFEGKKTVGLIAHMDTAPDFSGENVKPVIHENYDGSDIVLGDSGRTIRVKDFPDLASLKGRTVITSDGTTLLGADDKAGVTAIMTAVIWLKKHPEVKHCEVHVCFTPDEEVGRGPDAFDVEKFNADYAYTVDGGDEAEVAYENFNAASARLLVDGVNVHPGEAKNIMVNAGLIAAEFTQTLPADQVPEKTEGREGFFGLMGLSGDVAHAELDYIIRDHDKEKFEEKKALFIKKADELKKAHPHAKIEALVEDSYENMISVINKHPEIVKLAEDAIRSEGLKPYSTPIRGGTDGARLSFMGLPCPNLGTGGYAYHGPFEHVSLEGMEHVTRELIYIASNPLE